MCNAVAFREILQEATEIDTRIGVRGDMRVKMCAVVLLINRPTLPPAEMTMRLT